MANSPTQQSPVREQTPVPAEFTHRVWPRILAIIAFFAAFEGILFHTGLYSSIVEPDSTTGYMELQLRNEIRRPNRIATRCWRWDTRGWLCCRAW